MEICRNRLQTESASNVVAFALVGHKRAETMVGSFASDYQRHFIGLFLHGAHVFRNG
jgi:hypothetical protein